MQSAFQALTVHNIEIASIFEHLADRWPHHVAEALSAIEGSSLVPALASEPGSRPVAFDRFPCFASICATTRYPNY